MDYALWRYKMKLYLLLAGIDLLILLAYPIVYIVQRLRKLTGTKQ
jgi:hypothetical protein